MAITTGGPGGLPRGLGHGVQRGGLGGLFFFFFFFPAFCHIFTPLKTPFFPTDPASLLAGYQGFYSDFLEIFKEIGDFSVIFHVFRPIFYPTQNPLFPNRSR